MAETEAPKRDQKAVDEEGQLDHFTLRFLRHAAAAAAAASPLRAQLFVDC